MGQEVKNPIDCQSKHGLSDSSVKTGKFLPCGSQEQKMCTFLGLKVKNAICDGTPPTCTPNVVNMSAQVFREPKSSNRIEISWFVKFLLTFDWFQGSAPLVGWGWVDGGWTLSGYLGDASCMCVQHACTQMHVHTHEYMYKHDSFLQMAAPIGKSWRIPLWHHCSHTHACMCMCACAHMHGVPPKHPDRVPHPYPPKERPLKSVKSQ